MQTKKVKAVGSKAEVYHETARHTSGGLKKKDLMKHKGRIVSKKQHAAGKKAIKRLFSLGYKPTKGKFVAMRKGQQGKAQKKKRQTKKRGGAAGIPGMSVEGGSGNNNAFKSLLDGMKM